MNLNLEMLLVRDAFSISDSNVRVISQVRKSMLLNYLVKPNVKPNITLPIFSLNFETLNQV